MKLTREPFKLVSAQSTAASFTSPAYEVLEIDVEAIQVNYSGTPSGTLKIQGSVDHTQDSMGNVINAGQWVDLYFSMNGGAPAPSVAIPANPSPVLFDLYGSGVNYLRIVYTGSGAGSFDAFVCGKRLGD